MSGMKSILGDTPFDAKSPHQMTRRSDPRTSYEAAASLSDLPELQGKVYRIVAASMPYGITDAELHESCCALYGERPESSYRKRRSDLADKGLVIDSGERRTVDGRSRIVWMVAR